MLHPYKVQLADEEGQGYYFFTTSSGIKYKILFLLVDNSYRDYPQFNKYFYSFVFERIDKTLKETDRIDARISHTVANVISRFFKKNPQGILSFTCDDLDGKHKARSVLFAKWFMSFNNSKTLDKIDVNINGSFSSLIIKKRRAYKSEIEAAFFEMCQLIN